MPTPNKKLKQAMLPFKLVESPASPAVTDSRKRKASSETDINGSSVEKIETQAPSTPSKTTQIAVVSLITPEKKSTSDGLSHGNGQSPTVSSSSGNNEAEEKEVENIEQIEVDKMDSDCEMVTPRTSSPSSRTSSASSVASANKSTASTSTPCTPASGANGCPPPKRRRLSYQEKVDRRKEKERLQEERQKKKEEKIRAEEEKRKKKEELKQKKQAELDAKQEEKLKRQEEKQKREEEKKQKEEEKRRLQEAKRSQKEEEQRKKEEKKLKQEEEEKKKAKAAASFVSFFQKKNSICKEEEVKIIPAEATFMDFQVKADMQLAPLCRTKFSPERRCELDKALSQILPSRLYLEEVRTGLYTPGQSNRTLFPAPDVEILDEDDPQWSEAEAPTSVKMPAPKLLQFCENRRPPYWGSWRKRSKVIGPRRPLGKDATLLVYEVDSDDEWEEEEPGESLSGSDGEEEEMDDTGYEVDNEFFVPHGYLSDEEGGDVEDDHSGGEGKGGDLQERLKLKEEEFLAQKNAKAKKVRPRVIGCIWIGLGPVENVKAEAILNLFGAVICVDTADNISTSKSLPPPSPPTADRTTPPTSPPGRATIPSTSNSEQRKEFPIDGLPFLVDLVHGNPHKKSFLAHEFCEWWQLHQKNGSIAPSLPLSLKTTRGKITELAKWCKPPTPEITASSVWPTMCWWVDKDIRKKLGKEELSIRPATWEYVKEVPTATNSTSERGGSPMARKPSTPLITNFTKVLTAEERQKNLLAPASTLGNSPVTTPSKTSSANKLESALAKTTPVTSIPTKNGTVAPRTGQATLTEMLLQAKRADTSSPKMVLETALPKTLNKEPETVVKSTLSLHTPANEPKDVIVLD